MPCGTIRISKLNQSGNSDLSSRIGWDDFPHLLVRLEHILTRKKFLPFDNWNCPLWDLRISKQIGELLEMYSLSHWHHPRSLLSRQKWKWGNLDHPSYLTRERFVKPLPSSHYSLEAYSWDKSCPSLFRLSFHRKSHLTWSQAEKDFLLHSMDTQVFSLCPLIIGHPFRNLLSSSQAERKLDCLFRTYESTRECNQNRGLAVVSPCARSLWNRINLAHMNFKMMMLENFVVSNSTGFAIFPVTIFVALAIAINSHALLEWQREICL